VVGDAKGCRGARRQRGGHANAGWWITMPLSVRHGPVRWPFCKATAVAGWRFYRAVTP
jgi:hypothetical protein